MMNMNNADMACKETLTQNANNRYALKSIKSDVEVQAFYHQVQQRFLQQSARYLEHSRN